MGNLLRNAWQIAQAYKDSEFARRCGSLEAVFELQGEPVTKDKISEVVKVSISGKNFYVKRYFKPRARGFGCIIRSRVRSEWENLQFFDSLGIPVPCLAAWGEDLRAGVFRGALITEELPNAEDLATINQQAGAFFDRRDWFCHVAQQVACYTKRLHDQQFMHLDLKWRNILVGAGDQPQVFFFDCPSGKRLPALLFRRARLKDLACLDKLGRKRLRRTQRLAFYKYYAGCDKLSARDKAMVRKIDRFSAYLEGESNEAGWRIF
jgi:tRNA A-37 threonylcarbamoyl transferase component Bud32